MGPMSPICDYSHWAGLCPEKLAEQNMLGEHEKSL